MRVVPRISNNAIRRAAPRSDMGPAQRIPSLSAEFPDGPPYAHSSWFACGGRASRLRETRAGWPLWSKSTKICTQSLSPIWKRSRSVANRTSLIPWRAEVRMLMSHAGSQSHLDTLPVQVQPEIPTNLPPAENAVRIRLRKLQSDYAINLFALSRKALKEQHPSLAFQLVSEILMQIPDHPQARGLLGYKRVGNEWLTPFDDRDEKREKSLAR
jgi:hypothetical protein